MTAANALGLPTPKPGISEFDTLADLAMLAEAITPGCRVYTHAGSTAWVSPGRWVSVLYVEAVTPDGPTGAVGASVALDTAMMDDQDNGRPFDPSDAAWRHGLDVGLLDVVPFDPERPGGMGRIQVSWRQADTDQVALKARRLMREALHPSRNRAAASKPTQTDERSIATEGSM